MNFPGPTSILDEDLRLFWLNKNSYAINKSLILWGQAPFFLIYALVAALSVSDLISSSPISEILDMSIIAI